MIFFNWRQRLLQVAFVATAGTVLELSCAGVSEKVVNNVNPCGVILNCDPVEYDLFTTDYPDWNVDPTCTIPGQCGGSFPMGGATTTE